MRTSGFYHCTFELCTFERNTIKKNLFDGCCFINCIFYDISIVDSEEPLEKSEFIACKGCDSLQKQLWPKLNTEQKTDELYFEKLVLEQFWKKGAEQAEPRKTRLTLMRGISQRDHANIGKAIERLIRKEILIELTNCVKLNFSKLGEIKNILGR